MMPRFKSKIFDNTLEKEALQVLKDKGAKMRQVDPNYRLHDKLIIVDSRFVVEGSTNWSVSALKSNFESNTLIDSPELAGVKLGRLEALPLETDKPQKIRRRYVGGEPASLPEGSIIQVKKVLMENENFFPKMVMYHGERTLDTYLLLLAESRKWALAREKGQAREIIVSGEDVYFPVDLELVAEDLKITTFGPWPSTAKRRQVIKTLRKLQDRYKLITCVFQYGEDAWVTLKDLPGDTFGVESSFFDPGFLASKNTAGTFVILMKALLKEEGKTLGSYTREGLHERFHVGISVIRKGIWEIGE